MNTKMKSIILLFIFISVVLAQSQVPFVSRYPYGCGPLPLSPCVVTVNGVANVTCSNHLTDPRNCGGCGIVCTAPTTTCSTGNCICPGTGNIYCNGVCVPSATSQNNCGKCGNVCPAGVSCVNSLCDCTVGTTPSLCDGVCVDESNDPNNCGGCGIKCAPGVICSAGGCTAPLGQVYCNGAYIPVDANNCGVCGTACTGTLPVCSISATTGVPVCVAAAYNDITCISTSDVGLNALGATAIYTSQPYGTTFTASNCYSYCLAAIGATTYVPPFYFTLSQDTTGNTVTTQCYCYDGVTYTPAPATVTGCANGQGVTASGAGVLELYGSPNLTPTG
jgi:hypothetical protein